MAKEQMEARETFDLWKSLQRALERESAITLKSKSAIIREALMQRLGWTPKEAGK